MYLKIKCGNEIRKCAVEAESITYADLLQKVIQLFPSLREAKVESVELGYKDLDNDVVCISSDEELRTAFDQAQSDTLTVVVTSVTESVAEDEVSLGDLLHHGGDLLGGVWGHGSPFHPHGGPPFHSHSIFDPAPLFPFHHHLHGGGLGRHHQPSLFESPTTFRDRVLRAREEELRQQRKFEEKMHQAQLERHKALLEQAKQIREERMKEINENRRKSQDLQRMSSKEGGKVKEAAAAQPVIPEFPAGWIVRPIGGWDPVVHEGSGFHSTSYGPYGYYASYGSEDTEEDKPKEGEPEEPKDEGEPVLMEQEPVAEEQEQA